MSIHRDYTTWPEPIVRLGPVSVGYGVNSPQTTFNGPEEDIEPTLRMTDEVEKGIEPTDEPADAPDDWGDDHAGDGDEDAEEVEG